MLFLRMQKKSKEKNSEKIERNSVDKNMDSEHGFMDSCLSKKWNICPFVFACISFLLVCNVFTVICVEFDLSRFQVIENWLYFLSTLINAFLDLLLDLDKTQTSKTELGKLDEQHVSGVKAGRKRKPDFVWKEKVSHWKTRLWLWKCTCHLGIQITISASKREYCMQFQVKSTKWNSQS